MRSGKPCHASAKNGRDTCERHRPKPPAPKLSPEARRMLVYLIAKRRRDLSVEIEPVAEWQRAALGELSRWGGYLTRGAYCSGVVGVTNAADWSWARVIVCSWAQDVLAYTAEPGQPAAL